ncbi:5'-nucleotidase C-terminal domain-containing protein [Bacteroidales bacterium OttesenSCG-928-B11]|nr:5'-nucleotidase C-terminal domain-containing protein [Bacteroidales bacterium OttesenSCG-928-B11]
MKNNIVQVIFLPIVFLILLIFPIMVSAQKDKPFEIERATILLDSTYDSKIESPITQKIAYYRELLSAEMDVVIAQCSETLASYEPASPLSNLLTDLLFDYGDRYMREQGVEKTGVSLLNFGGIRNVMPQGNVTVSDIYKIAPFENRVVIITIKGSELKKVFNRFTEKRNQPYSQLEMIYFNNKPDKITINGKSINDNDEYHLVTVDFIQNGGDAILKDVEFVKVAETNELLRDVLVEEIKKITTAGKIITPVKDNRVIIRPQF